ncbi:hypothetical protein A6P39_041900 (plasmid) [Streptomyces sp. FXJ1.172]|uniref:hypothetical protein n=1 Tax=Streptomyces sp. FXJ1.172 TaxID=710705 RepID=UPI0023DD602B|nr:hypothetical protein [Streptomyces sp. FXJ1.172]WEP00732.1 hypothetical protein A6P39_041900 [Streptomyces sp. FXJ1.172]
MRPEDPRHRGRGEPHRLLPEEEPRRHHPPRHPYQHLAEEFERRLKALHKAGQIVDPRAAQIDRLKAQVAELKERLAKRDEALAELTAFKTLAISRLTAQHEEIEHLREQAAAVGNVCCLPAARSSTAPYGSCS